MNAREKDIDGIQCTQLSIRSMFVNCRFLRQSGRNAQQHRRCQFQIFVKPNCTSPLPLSQLNNPLEQKQMDFSINKYTELLHTVTGNSVHSCGLVEALHYTQESRGIDSRWYNWNLPAAVWPLGSTQPPTEMSTRKVKAASA